MEPAARSAWNYRLARRDGHLTRVTWRPRSLTAVPMCPPCWPDWTGPARRKFSLHNFPPEPPDMSGTTQNPAAEAPLPPPLAGVTVDSLEQAVAAPFATRQLADLGARVIKVERPGGGDFARRYDETVRGLSSHFVWLNRTKESIELD